MIVIDEHALLKVKPIIRRLAYARSHLEHESKYWNSVL